MATETLNQKPTKRFYSTHVNSRWTCRVCESTGVVEQFTNKRQKDAPVGSMKEFNIKQSHEDHPEHKDLAIEFYVYEDFRDVSIESLDRAKAWRIKHGIGR